MAASFLDELRTMADRVHGHATKELQVPGSGGRIAVRYRPPSRDKLTALLTAYTFAGALSGDEETQLLVDCCDTVLACDPETGDTSPFDDEGPLRFDASDERWGDDVETARDCVAKLFRLDVQPLAASRHVGSLVDWLNGIDAEISARVEGKSVAPETS